MSDAAKQQQSVCVTVTLQDKDGSLVAYIRTALPQIRTDRRKVSPARVSCKLSASLNHTAQ